VLPTNTRGILENLAGYICFFKFLRNFFLNGGVDSFVINEGSSKYNIFKLLCLTQ